MLGGTFEGNVSVNIPEWLSPTLKGLSQAAVELVELEPKGEASNRLTSGDEVREDVTSVFPTELGETTRSCRSSEVEDVLLGGELADD